MEFLNCGPLMGEKFQFMGWVVGCGLGPAPTSLGYACIHTILMGLIEDSPQARPKSIGMELKRTGEICIGKDRGGGAQSFQVIRGLLTPVAPHDGSLSYQHSDPRLTHAGLGYLHEFQDKPAIVTHEFQETSHLSDICWD